MSLYLGLAPMIRIMIILLYFMLICASMYIHLDASLFVEYKQVRYLSFISLAFKFVLLIILVMGHTDNDAVVNIYKFINPLVLLLLTIGIIITDFISFIYLSKWKKTEITTSSLKEALDNLPNGLCYYNSEGVLLLANKIMLDLYHQITDNSLINISGMWDILVEGKLKVGNVVEAKENEIIVNINDDKIYSFTRKFMDDGIIQVVAVDITSMYMVYSEMRDENNKLEQLNARLREYSSEMDDLIKSEELLNARIRIHDELGRMLINTKRLLSTELDSTSLKENLIDWRQTFKLLNNPNVQLDRKPNVLRQVIVAAKELGLDIELKGRIPERDKYSRLIVAATRECLTNAYHGDAKKITIEIKEYSNHYDVVFTNDGKEPTYPVKLGGGLGNLAILLGNNNASLEVASKPKFYVKVRINK